MKSDLKDYLYNSVDGMASPELKNELDSPSVSEDNMMINIAIKKTWCPQKLGINEDYRELGIAISEIGLTP